jgi:integrase
VHVCVGENAHELAIDGTGVDHGAHPLRRHHYREHFAKVTVRAGEVLSAGTLVIDYNTDGAIIRPTFSGSAHVEDYSPKTLASLKKRYPATLARAKKSPLIVLSAIERKNGVLPSKPTTSH